MIMRIVIVKIKISKVSQLKEKKESILLIKKSKAGKNYSRIQKK